MSARHSPAAIATALTFAEIEPPNLRGPFTYVACTGIATGAQASRLADEYPWAHVVSGTIAQIQNMALPARIDMLVLDNIWSWGDADIRAKAHELISARLSRTGLVVLDYACPPGATFPALLNRAGLDLAERIRTCGSRLFTANPALSDILNAMKGRLPNRKIHVTPFDELRSELQTHGLEFAGSAFMSDAIPKLNFSPASQRLLQAEPDLVLRELKKDILLNRGYRCDVFIRNPKTMTSNVAAERMAATPFAPQVPSERIDTMVLRTAYADIRPSETVRKVFANLSAAGQSALDLAQHKNPGCENVWSNVEALLILMAMEAARPLVASSIP